MPEHIEMQTERLLLRPFNLSDVDDVYAHASDPKRGRFVPVPCPSSRTLPTVRLRPLRRSP